MSRLIYDVEVYPNYHGIGFLDDAGVVTQFSTLRGNLDQVIGAIAGHTLVGFNNHSYDDHILMEMLLGASCAEVYAASQARINAREKWPNSPIPDTIDLAAIADRERIGSLKEVGIKLDHPRLQELPYRFDLALTPEQMAEVEAYNVNDLRVTAAMAENMADALAARDALSTYADVRNRKDSGIAEALLRARLFDGEKPTYPWRKSWSVMGDDVIDPRIRFETRVMQEMLDTMRAWSLSSSIERDLVTGEKTLTPPVVPGLEVRLNDTVYTVALGGLHSRDLPAVVLADDEFELIDIDVASYYPNMILGFGLAPEHLDRDRFLAEFRAIVDERIRAKKAGEKALNLGLKIAINSIYGKFGSAYSWLCDPVVKWRINLNGQLILLMLCERIEAEVGSVVSANTDGILVRMPRGKRDELTRVVGEIEREFAFSFDYGSVEVYARASGNNYVALDADEKIKGKGAYGYDRSDLKKKATERVVVDAAQRYFTSGVPVRETVEACRDLRDFVDYFKATGSYFIEQGGIEVGKIARWVRVKAGEPITKIKRDTGGRTILAGGKPVLLLADLPDTMDGIDIDIDHYCEAAQRLIDAIERPRIDNTSTLALADLSREQVALFSSNHADTTTTPERVGVVDVEALRAIYADCGRQQYDTMIKRLLPRAWAAGAGRLTRGDLAEIARQIDEGTGYFAPRDKAKSLASAIEWVARTRCPFPALRTTQQIVESALLWAERTVSPNDHQVRIAGVHRLVQKPAWDAYVASGDLNKLACSMAARARKNGFAVTVEALAAELDERVAAKDGQSSAVVVELPEKSKESEVNDESINLNIEVGEAERPQEGTVVMANISSISVTTPYQLRSNLAARSITRRISL